MEMEEVSGSGESSLGVSMISSSSSSSSFKSSKSSQMEVVFELAKRVELEAKEDMLTITKGLRLESKHLSWKYHATFVNHAR